MKRMWMFMLVALAAATVSRGATNYCLQLPGTDSAMVTPTNSYGDRLRDFTVSARIRPAQLSSISNQVVAERILRAGSQSWTKFSLGLGHDNRPFFRFETLGHNLYAVNATTPIRTGRWSHVAAAYDHVSGMACVFVNGKLAGSQAIFEESAPESILTGTTTVGAHASTNETPALDACFAGWMDEVQVWDGAFAQPQIASNLYAKPSGTEPKLVGCWNFDDQTAGDVTTNGLDGALLGAAAIVPRHIACDPPLSLSCGDPVLFRFQSLPDTPYAVEYCTNLSAGTWTALQDEVAGDGGIIQIEDPAGANAGRFYRAKAPLDP